MLLETDKSSRKKKKKAEIFVKQKFAFELFAQTHKKTDFKFLRISAVFFNKFVNVIFGNSFFKDCDLEDAFLANRPEKKSLNVPDLPQNRSYKTRTYCNSNGKPKLQILEP